MANTNAPFGFRPSRHLAGGMIRTSRGYRIQSGYATNIFTGDAVIISSGYINIGAENSATLLGVFAGCEFLDSSGVPGGRFMPYWPASTTTTGSADVIAYVYDDPLIIYAVQTYSVTTYAKASHLLNSYDLISNTAGSTYTGMSGMELNLGDTGSTQWQVLGISEIPGNAEGANAVVECRLRKSSVSTN